MHEDRSDDYIVEMVLDSNLSIEQIAENLNISSKVLRHRIKLLGIDWALKQTRSVSRGQTALTDIVKKVIPGDEIVNEYSIGEKLRLDIYCPKYKVGVEYHGRQHFEHVSFFHETYEDFVRSMERDERKIELCKELGIALVIFRYTDKIDYETVYDRIYSAIKESSNDKLQIKKPKRSLKDHPEYRSIKDKRNVFYKEIRKQLREERKKERQKKTDES